MAIRKPIALSALLVIVGAADLHAAGDVEVGRAIAQRWCASCHVVGSGTTGGSDVAPAFGTIAATRTPDQLRAFLANPHFPMPNPQLSRSEIEHVVAYIESLAPR
jgi:cytochrome c